MRVIADKNRTMTKLKLLADDLSNLLFNCSDQGDNFSLPLVGPIDISTQSDSISHGRGLVTTRTVQAGEMLFVIKPQLCAPIEAVYQRWCTKGARGCRATLEEVAEAVLLDQMRECLQVGDEKQILSFMLQLGEEKDEESKLQGLSSDLYLGSLLGRSSAKNMFDLKYDWIQNGSDENLLSIIRRNAFGPDYHNYATMEKKWNSKKDAASVAGTAPYSRVLGLYPLAAMINHSCSPNAVRVFVGEVMVVHACAVIPRGSEIVWSYIVPNQPYRVRCNEIYSKYGFRCCCCRCKQEETAYRQVPTLHDQLVRFDPINCQSAPLNFTSKELSRLKDDLEYLLANEKLSNELKRYLRVGYLNFYIYYFNMTLAGIDQDNENASEIRLTILTLAAQLHFALVTCNNACIAHLSILHMAYELAAIISRSSVVGNVKTKSMVANIQFWTEQLKRVHMIRYGALGQNLENTREVMKHTRSVVRNIDGLSEAQWRFI